MLDEVHPKTLHEIVFQVLADEGKRGHTCEVLSGLFMAGNCSTCTASLMAREIQKTSFWTEPS